MTNHRRMLASLLLLSACACSNSASTGADGPYGRGLQALSEGQPSVARVELLNAVKSNPDDAKARIALATAHLELQDGLAAQAELERALKLGAKPAGLGHLLGHAFLLQKQYDRAIAEAGAAGPAHAGYAARIRAMAYRGKGDLATAGAELDKAIAAAPNDASVWLETGRFRRFNGNIAAAIEAVDKAVKLDPRNVAALTLRGELTRSQYGLRAALPWFTRAIEIDPDNIPALLERAATYGDLGEMRAMLADSRAVLALNEKNPVAFQLQAMMAARAGKFELARSLHQRTGGLLDNEPSNMLLASAIDFQTGNVEQAISRLSRLVARQPNNIKARRLLASAHLKQGDAAKTIATLRPVVDRPDADSYSLALMGDALRRTGDTEAAARYLARASQPQRREASSLISAPVSEEQLNALRRHADEKPGQAPAQVALIGALLSTGAGEEALERALRLQADNGGAPDAHVLVGDARGMRGDFRGAAEEYRKAANISFTEPVVLRLIEALRRSGQGEAASKVLLLFLDQNPRNVPAMLLVGGGFMEQKRWADAVRVYEGLRSRLGDRDAVMLNNLAWAYAELGQWDRAEPLARQAWSLDKDNPATADTYGWILFKSGKDKVRGLALIEQASRGAPTDREIRARLMAARKAGG